MPSHGDTCNCLSHVSRVIAYNLLITHSQSYLCLQILWDPLTVEFIILEINSCYVSKAATISAELTVIMK